MDDGWITIGELVQRSGLPHSALRHYEAVGLIASERTPGNQRRYRRSTLRRVAFVRAAQSVGLSLEAIRAALDQLPQSRTPGTADWKRLASAWKPMLDERIAILMALRDRLDACIGCGCLSMRKCALYNPDDRVGERGPGAHLLLPARASPRRARKPRGA